MRDQLESWRRDPVPGLTLNFPEQTMTEALRFQLMSPTLASWMDVSLLPVFDAVGEGCPACALGVSGNIAWGACSPLCDSFPYFTSIGTTLRSLQSWSSSAHNYLGLLTLQKFSL